jgi:LCP family protein required for cell wall assembly
VVASALVLLVSVGGYAVVHHYTGRLGHTGIRLPGVAVPADTDGPAQDFLLAGSDTRDFAGGQAFQAAPGSADYVSGQRSDTVILVHLPAGAAKATLVSFPRDSYVQIPAYTDGQGHPHQPYPAKLNEAFAVGGPALLVQLIENLSGLRVDHFVEVDFAGFKTMVDALGGVTLCVNTTRHDHDSGDMLTKGVHADVNGEDALAFVRDRKGLSNGDLDRIADQQYFLAQMMAKVTSAGTLANPLKINAFLSTLTASVTVDNALGFADIRSLATRLRHLDPAHVAFATIPITTDSATRTIHGVGQSIVLIDEPKATALFGQLRGMLPRCRRPPRPLRRPW